MNEISEDTFSLFCYRVELHGIISAAQIAEHRYGGKVAHELLGRWYALQAGEGERIVQGDTNIAARGNALRLAR